MITGKKFYHGSYEIGRMIMDDYLAAGTAQYSRISYFETTMSGFLFCSMKGCTSAPKIDLQVWKK